MPEQLSLSIFEAVKEAPPSATLQELWTPDDIFLNADAATIASFHEDYRVERKSARKEPKGLAPTLSAFANMQPYGGVVFVGVENDGAITGFGEMDKSRPSQFESVEEYCPDAKLDFRRVPVTNARGEPDFIIAIRVHYHPSRLVETHGREAYMRRGNANRRLSEDEKREIRIAKGEIDYEQESVQLSYPEDFNIPLVAEFCQSFVAVRSLAPTHLYEDILELNHLGTKKGGAFLPNLACALLFAKDPRKICPGARIRFQRFEGESEGTGADYNLIRDIFIDGPLPEILRDAEQVISGQMRNFTRLAQDGRFYTRPEYPKDAWIEAIVNATVHRSYNLKNMVIFVKMFDDRLAVESPGGFPPPVTSENIYGFHNPRNPFLMDALFYFGFVKCAHEGTPRMRDAMQSVGLPLPEFSQREVGHHQVHVTLRNNVQARKTFVDADAARLLGQKVFGDLTERQRLIVNYLTERGSINVSDANRVLQCDWRTARNVLDELVAKNILDRISASGKERDPKKRYVLHIDRSAR
jgi:ATP-dependent DNA helicase RecG